VVRGRARRLELLDGEIIDTDQLDPVRDEMASARLGHADIVRPEFGRAPEERVARLDQNPHVL
jgi:hypothetical protein